MLVMETILDFLSDDAWLGIYAITTLGLLLVAVMAARYAKRQWETSREQLLEEHRPYVTVTAEPSGASPQLFDLVVRNIGKRPALDVSIKLAPPPERASERGGAPIAETKMLNEPIFMLAPGQEMRVFYDNHIERREKGNLPTSHTASYSYKDSQERQFSEQSVLDLEALKGARFVNVKTVHDIGKSLRAIERIMKASSLNSQKGSLEVTAVVEERDEYIERVLREEAEEKAEYRRLKSLWGFAEDTAEKKEEE